MARNEHRRVREQVVVYMDEADRKLLDELTAKTGLSKTEAFRRGLRQLAGQVLPQRKRGWSLQWLADNEIDDGGPADGAERHDYYIALATGAKALGRGKNRHSAAKEKKKHARTR